MSHPDRLPPPRPDFATWRLGAAPTLSRCSAAAPTNEKAYLVGKFARVALGTANVDYNGRFCMSSAAVAVTRAFGVDRGLPFPLEEIPYASVVMLARRQPGGNDAAAV